MKIVKMKPTIIYRTIVKKIYVYGCPKGYAVDPDGRCQPQGNG